MTYPEYRAAVIADILDQMNGEPDGAMLWTQEDAESCVGDVSDMHAARRTPRDAANSILYIASQDA